MYSSVPTRVRLNAEYACSLPNPRPRVIRTFALLPMACKKFEALCGSQSLQFMLDVTARGPAGLLIARVHRGHGDDRSVKYGNAT